MLLPDLLAVILEYLPGDEFVKYRASGCFGRKDSAWLDVVRRISTKVTISHSKYVSSIRGVRNVDVSYARGNISDDDVSHLFDARIVNLGACHFITDAGLAHLRAAHTVGLRWCSGITDAGLVYLQNAHIGACHFITDAGLVHLKNAHTVDLSCCISVTDAGLKHLKCARIVGVYYCPGVTDTNFINGMTLYVTDYKALYLDEF